MDPFAGAGASPDGDPFAGPADIPSEYPKLANLKGRLLMLAPTKYEPGIPSAFRNNDGTVQLQNRMTVDVYVVDGGPVPGFAPSAFPSMYVSNGRLVDQMMKGYRDHHMVLGRLGLFKPERDPGAGNPWGLSDPTDQDKAAARAYIAAGNRQPGEGPDGFPVQAAPPAAAPAPSQDPWAQQAPAAPAGWGPPPAPVPAAAGVFDPFA